MSVSRFLLSWILGLALAGAPVLHALGKGMLPFQETAASVKHVHTDTKHHHDSSISSCAQHDACDGQCCSSCAQSFTTPSFVQVTEDHNRPVLTAAVQHLVFSSPVFLRERPPRFLSL